MRLQRLVKAYTKTVEFNWCRREFMEMSPQYRAIRAKTSAKMDACYWCRHKFEDGEMMALAQPTTGKNKVLCQACADQLLATRDHVHG